MNAGDIFIVDDNPANLALLAGVLREHGYHVRMAHNGERALHAVHEHPPDILLLDIQLPDIDGFEVCRKLKEDAATRAVPVIFLSALGDVLYKVRAFRAGGVDYVEKPFEPEEIVARIERQLQTARLRSALEAATSDLARRNAELSAKNDELVRAQRRTDLVFTALSESLPGTVLDQKYEIGKVIGTGGFGTVYSATHIGLKRPVAIKVFRPVAGNDSAASLERFRREGISACRVAHQSAVSILDNGVSPSGIAYLVMELLRGRTLAQVLSRDGPIAVERCGSIFAQACSALVAAHAAGVVHRDIKPENIFLHRLPEGEIVKILDFGLAKLLEGDPDLSDTTSSISSDLLGTPAYIAPERLLGLEYDGRADVYGLGVTIFRTLSGKLPFKAGDGSIRALIACCLTDKPQRLADVLPDVPLAVSAAIDRALAKDPADRPTANEFAKEFAAACGMNADRPGS